MNACDWAIFARLQNHTIQQRAGGQGEILADVENSWNFALDMSLLLLKETEEKMQRLENRESIIRAKNLAR